MPCISPKWVYVKSAVCTTITDFGEKKIEKILLASEALQPSVHLFPIKAGPTAQSSSVYQTKFVKKLKYIFRRDPK